MTEADKQYIPVPRFQLAFLQDLAIKFMNETCEDVMCFATGKVEIRYPRKLTEDDIADIETLLVMIVKKMRRQNAETKVGPQ